VHFNNTERGINMWKRNISCITTRKETKEKIEKNKIKAIK